VCSNIFYQIAAYMLDASGLAASTGLGGAGDGDLLLNVFLILGSDRYFVNLRDPFSEGSIFSCGFFPAFGTGVESALDVHRPNFDRIGIVNQIECSVVSILTSNYELYRALGWVIGYSKVM
jgi:hypothetical protein